MLKSLSYLIQTQVLRKKRLRACAPDLNLAFNIAAFDVVGRSIFKRGIYEPEITRWFLKGVEFKENDVFIDIGANIGWYSVLVDKYHPSCKKVFSFEPDDMNYDLFCQNIQLNNCRRIKAEKYALSNEEGTKRLYRYSNRNLGRHSLLPINDGDSIEISTVVLDDYWNKNTSPELFPRLIKIDTEGYEFQVLQGAKALLGVCPLIMAEFSPHFMRQAGVSPDEFLDFMYDYEYEPHLFSSNGLTVTDRGYLDQVQKNENVLWAKK